MPFCNSSRCFERTRDFGQRCFLGFAYRHSTAKKSSTFVRRFGDVLADLLQPALIGCSIARHFCIDYGSGLPQRLDALIIDLGRLLPLNLVFNASRAALPSAVLKSSTTALMRALVPGSVFAFASAVPPAKLSFRRPHNPLGSAAVIAIPHAITLSKRTFHSSA